MADVRETKVSITLAEYTRLTMMEHDFERVKAVVDKAEDKYLDTETFVLLKVLCGCNVKENKNES